ncbi:2Fe-2S iron-sulfur cluster-binding protein [Alsobacter sp. R-9]
MSATAWIRSTRLVSGLVLMTFVAGHLLTVAAGLVSTDAIARMAGILMRPWGTGLGRTLLTASIVLHLLAGLQAIAARRSLTGRRADAVQVALGLAILPLLLPHVLTMTVAQDYAPRLDLDFSRLLAFYWHLAPSFAIQQLLVVVVVWAHASIGLTGWMSLQRWWPAAGPLVTPLLFAVPILALLGFVEAGQAVLLRLDTDPAFAAEVARQWALLQGAQGPLGAVRQATIVTYWAAVGLALAVLGLRMVRSRGEAIRVDYDGGMQGEGRRGLSVLEISRLSHVPHASVCSGRGRCGTCRVKVLAGARSLTPMDDIERWTLGASARDGSVRLACRARVIDAGVAVERLLPPDADASAARRPQDWLAPAAPGPAASSAEAT